MQTDSGSKEQYSNDDQVHDLLSHVPFEKINRDFSGSILQKLKEPSKTYNPFWELIYLMVVFGLLSIAVYMFIRVDDSDLDATGTIRRLSGQDKLIFALGIFVAVAVAALFISRYQRFKKRITEINNMP